MSEHGPHADPHDPFQKRLALSMAMYAVLLTFVTMLGNSTRTEAILLASHANDQWAFYQSKSTKGALVKAEADLLGALAPAADDKDKDRIERIAKAKEHFLAETERYDKEKEGIKEEADKLATEGKVCERKEAQFEYAAVAIELGIVLATVALLLTSKPMALLSGLIVLGGVGWAGKTAMIEVEPQHSESTSHGKSEKSEKGEKPSASAEGEHKPDATAEPKH